MPLAACRLPLAAILLVLCSLALAASSNGDNPPHGGNFADFYKAQQTRILAHIDDTLATKAERAITGNFAAVKSAGVQLQTGLGGRKGNIGVNVIGAFADSDTRAFGWQVRGYGGEDSTFGANAGIFYRKIDGDMLFGANAFADYEDGDYGNFTRLGIGGELHNAWLSFNANYYAPITDEKPVNMTVAAFSRQGFDAKLRINPPSYDKLKAAVDYYNFDGKHGAESEEGLRYGMELNISPALKAGLFYDDGADKVGGELAYSHTIGESQTLHSRAEGAGISHSPDLFAPVSREYSQRIITVATGPGISLDISIVSIMTTAMTTEAMTITTTIVAGFITTTTRMTASITTTTTMTTPPVTTTTTMDNLMTVASRVASVQVSTRFLFGPAFEEVTTAFRFVVTLPPLPVMRPIVIRTRRNLHQEVVASGVSNVSVAIVIVDNGSSFPGDAIPFLNSAYDYDLTVVEGSEQFVSITTTMTTSITTTMAAVMTETTMTMAGEITETRTTMALMPTTTTMTILPISTTMRATTFATMFITLTANAAMGGKLPFDDGGGKGGGITKPPLAIALSPSSPFRPRRHSRAHHRHSRAAGAGIS